MNNYLKEITALWNKIGEVERKTSGFTDLKTNVIKSDMSEDWTPTIVYAPDEYVMHNNRLWICKIQNESTEPKENSPYWGKVNIASEFNRLASIIKEGKL